MKYALYTGWAVIIGVFLCVACLAVMLAAEFAASFGGFLPWILALLIGVIILESFVRLVRTMINHLSRFHDIF